MKQPRALRLAVYALSVLSLTPGFAPYANAAILPTQAVIAGAQRDANLARVHRALDGERLRALLLERGVSPQAVDDRLAGLSDSELATLANRLDQLPAGGDGLFALLGVVFIVLLVLDLTDTIQVFHHGARSGRR